MGLEQAGMPSAARVPRDDVMRWRLLLDAVRAIDGPAARDVAAWVEATDHEWPFSFQNVCESLGVDPTVVRAALLGAHRRPAAAA